TTSSTGAAIATDIDRRGSTRCRLAAKYGRIPGEEPASSFNVPHTWHYRRTSAAKERPTLNTARCKRTRKLSVADWTSWRPIGSRLLNEWSGSGGRSLRHLALKENSLPLTSTPTLRGMKLSDLRAVQPSKFELVLTVRPPGCLRSPCRTFQP